MRRLGGTARLAAGLLLVGAVSAGCGSGGKAATTSTDAGVTVAPNVTSASSPTTVVVPASATATAAETSSLSFADGQLQSLDGDIGTAQAGVSAQEADPTK